MTINEYLKLSSEDIEKIISCDETAMNDMGNAIRSFIYTYDIFYGLSDYTLNAIENFTPEDFAKILGGAKGKAEIELRISQKFYFDKTVVNEYGNVYEVDSALHLMDKELMDDIYNELSPCTEQAFFNEYIKRHKEKFDEEWELAKENPCR